MKTYTQLVEDAKQLDLKLEQLRLANGSDLLRVKAERDEARRAICERMAHGRPGHESDSDYETPADASHDHPGWGYLYSEQGQEPLSLDAAARVARVAQLKQELESQWAMFCEATRKSDEAHQQHVELLRAECARLALERDNALASSANDLEALELALAAAAELEQQHDVRVVASDQEQATSDQVLLAARLGYLRFAARDFDPGEVELPVDKVVRLGATTLELLISAGQLSVWIDGRQRQEQG